MFGFTDNITYRFSDSDRRYITSPHGKTYRGGGLFLTSMAAGWRSMWSQLALDPLEAAIKCSAEQVLLFCRHDGGGGRRRLELHVDLCGVAWCIGRCAA